MYPPHTTLVCVLPYSPSHFRRISDGFAVGVITACNKRPPPPTGSQAQAQAQTQSQPDFTTDDELLLETLSVHFGVMLANCLTHEKGMADRRKANALVLLAAGTLSAPPACAACAACAACDLSEIPRVSMATRNH